jgi:hypothetical protein
VSVLIYDDPLISYERKEFDFFKDVTHILLKEVLTRHKIEHVLPHVLKTTTSMLKSHYTDVNDSHKDKVTQVAAVDYEIPDIFAEEYLKTKDEKVFGEKTASYIKGWWGGVMEGGLIN